MDKSVAALLLAFVQQRAAQAALHTSGVPLQGIMVPCVDMCKIAFCKFWIFFRVSFIE